MHWRLGWILLGILLAVAFIGASWAWYLLAGAPWLAGGTALFGGRGERAAGSWLEAVRAPGASACLIGWFGLLAGVGLVFKLEGTLLASVWLGALGLLVGAAARPGRLTALLTGSFVLAVAVTLMALAAEGAFRLPAIQQRFGLPAELAAWPSRYDRTQEANVLGLRSEYEQVHKDPGALRILALGDSFTWGDKIASSDSTWPALLESNLRRAWPRVEVVNMGQRGFTTANEAELLSRVGWQWCPDLIVIQFYVNDVLPSGPNLEHRTTDWLFPRKRFVPVRLRSERLVSSALLAFLEQQLNRLWRWRELYGEYAALYRDDFRGWQQIRRALRYIGEAAAARNVPALVILYPTLMPGEWTKDSYPLREVHDKVADASMAAGLEVLDLVDSFAAAGGDWTRWHATPYDSHPSAAASLLVADAVMKVVENRRLLPRVERPGPTSSATPLPRAVCVPGDEGFVP